MNGMTVPGLVEAAATRHGERVFLTVDGTTRTYAQAREAAATMAGALAARGCRPGDRVAALLPNRVELVDLVLGCAWLGAVVVPLNTALHGRLLRHALGVCEPQFVYVDEELAGRVRELGCGGEVWVTGTRQAPAPWVVEALDPHPSRPGDTAAILFTSGTTGPSRGVRCPHAQFVWWGRNVADSLRLTADDTLYTCLPLFHTNALNTLAQAMTVGASVVVDRRFSASRHWARAAETGATCVYVLGAMVPMLLAQPPGPGDRAHGAWRGLGPGTPGALWETFRDRFGVTLVDGFGSTETNLVIGSVPEECRSGYMGTVRDGFEARVVEADLSDVPDGTPGELIVRTTREHALATGYVGEGAPEPGSWRRTGDRVVREPDGWFRFVDRVKDRIRRRGENISSYEVETALRAHPDVAEAAAFPVPSELAEDEVMVAVVPCAGRSLDPAEVARHCAGELPGFAVPRFVDVVGELPLTETGKVRKSLLRERGVTGGTWDRLRRSSAG
ncbi:ATP-dependent acyl-CoA ligase [Streptomyces longisporoflavus]|uniref:AMP-binding protein n=1 Tax=Streptomyces longisporoflavus TaxID=28044 RepID=UPI00167D0AA5|nr:AMP-binding protein [Streptomyces longisporoflavus]GGV63152.1 ATP-dependent acyl-CoA ligase [Streptomyces longisporoflavus]